MVWCGVVWCGVVWCGVVWCKHGVVLALSADAQCYNAFFPSPTGCGAGCFPTDTLVFANFQEESLSISVNYTARDEAVLTVQWQYAGVCVCVCVCVVHLPVAVQLVRSATITVLGVTCVQMKGD